MRTFRKKPRRARRTPSRAVRNSPRTYPGRLTRPPPGYCRWCVAPILTRDGKLHRRKTFCSQRCVGEYLLRADPKVMRRHVFLRDDGVCADCGAQHRYLDGDWQADHVKPLFMAFGDRSFWEPTNVQILCTDPCHKRKSAADRVRYERPASTSKSKSQHSKRKNS